MQAESLFVPSNGMTFYCEKRGKGPLLVLVPSGCNDCGTFEQAADLLSDSFTVLSFDMRGGTRSMPPEDINVTPELLALDVIGIVRSLGYTQASYYGCSSGGQAVLTLGTLFPKEVVNIMVHEAALQSDTPLAETGFTYFKTVNQSFGPLCHGFEPKDLFFKCDWDKWAALGEELHNRVRKNGIYWNQYYLGTVDRKSYSTEELERIPNLEFSVGTWTPSWMVAANLTTAKRVNAPYTWLPAAHFPEIVCPEVFAEYLRKTCFKYL